MAHSGSSTDGAVDEVVNEARNIIEKVIDDVGKASATRQLIFGTTAGWFTGFILMKVGRAAAATIGSGVILLQVANYNGYININWDKLTRKAEKISEQLEDSGSSKNKNFLKKVGKYVDRKLDKAEDILEKKGQKAKTFIRRLQKDGDGIIFQEIHVFFASFLVGIAVGMLTGILFR